jgi:hypothetical protein
MGSVGPGGLDRSLGAGVRKSGVKMASGVGRGCALSLLAAMTSLCITYPVVAFLAYMKSPFFGWAGMHGGTWIILWWILFFPVYGIPVKIYDLRKRKKKGRIQT